jgi:hypothetical protein
MRTGILVLLTTISGCTLVTIEGSNNTVSDTGGHGGVVLAPQSPQDSRQDSRQDSAYIPLRHDH